MSTFDFPNVQPGVISAAYFILLDVFIVGILDIVLARVVCLAYYRDINRGKPIPVRSADVPGLSNYLLGHPLSFVNIIAVGVKLVLLIIILVANVSINSRNASVSTEKRTASFGLDPTHKYLGPNITDTVRRRFESSKSCFEEEGEQLTYYALRFDLVGVDELSDEEGNRPLVSGEPYDVNDSSIICMSPTNVESPVELIKVLGCTRVNRTAGQSCLSVVSAEQIKETPPQLGGGDDYIGTIPLTFVKFDQGSVDELFSEYQTPVLTCLSTNIGIDSSNPSSRYTHCLLVAKNDTDNGIVTIVERWILGPGKDKSPEGSMIMEYPGIIFEGDQPFGETASAQYLQVPFPFTDYVTLSGELVAQASLYSSLGNGKKARVFTNINQGIVTTVGRRPLIGVIVAAAIVLVSFVVTMFLLRSDRRPRFNTIDGLSSIVREEHAPSGRSYTTGESVILGLHFTNADTMHFGPLRDRSEGAIYQEGIDIS